MQQSRQYTGVLTRFVGFPVIGLQRLMVHIINKDLLNNRKGFKVAHHCLRSLLESMVDLKELLESSETDDSDSSSDSGSDSRSGNEEDDDDDSIDVRSGPYSLFSESTS